MTDTEILRMIGNGNTLTQIADLGGVPRGIVVRVAKAAGWDLNHSTDRFARPVTPIPVYPKGVTAPVPYRMPGKPLEANASEKTAPRSEGVHLVRAAHRDLIEEGKAHSLLRVQRAAIKAEASLNTLAALIDADREAEAERQRIAAEKQARVDRIAELKRLLDEEKAALAATRSTAATEVVTPIENGASAQTIRARAAEAGVDCPARGKVPQRVVDAYEAATRGGAA